MNPSFMNGTPMSGGRNDYVSDFAQARYYDRMNEANGSIYELHLDDRTTAKANQSPTGGLRGLVQLILMTLTHF